MRNVMYGKIAKNDVIEANMKNLVQLDRQFQELVTAGDVAGLAALADLASSLKQTSIARKAVKQPGS